LSPKFTILNEHRFVNMTLLLLFLTLLIIPFGFDYSEQSDAVYLFKYKFPRCTYKQLTGTVCPSCGLTRSVAALYRGNLQLSLFYNKAGIFLVIFSLIQTLLRLVPVIYKKEWLPWFDISQLILSFVILELYLFT